MKQLQKKTKRRLAIQYFLRKLKQRMESDKVNTMDAVWLNIYSKEDLMEIIKWLYVPNVPDWVKFDEMDAEQLLEAIGDDFHILSYEIELASEELAETTKVTPKKVFDTLQQLGLEAHYLMEKIIPEWNEYDYANYRALYQKAGNPLPVYGIFDSSVREEDKYFVTTPPPEYFHTLKDALDELEKLIREGELKEGEAKVMML